MKGAVLMFSSWLLICQSRRLGANCWAEGTGGNSRSQEEKADAGKQKRAFCHALEEEEHSNHVRSLEELRPVASATGRWPRMFGRG